MKVVIKPHNSPIQPKKAFPITDEEIEKGLQAGTLRKVKTNVYEEIEPDEYQTKVMTPKKKVGRPAKKKTVTRKRRAVKKASA